MIAFLRYWSPPLLLMAAIFFGSSFSKPPITAPPVPFGDKILHFITYAALSFFFARCFRFYHGYTTGKAVALAILCAATYGALDEFHQAFVPDRSVEFLDWLADLLGAMAAMIPYFLLYNRFIPRRELRKASTPFHPKPDTRSKHP
ncbi:MAG: VanZ family protein [Verrucomicrobiae bacterium]|nr:VanZ family protein [Verrucomicrobiae bacterium]